MSNRSNEPTEGIYRSDDGHLYSVVNVRRIDDDFIVFDFVESDDPEDLEAMASELTGEDWPLVVEELGLVSVKDIV